MEREIPTVTAISPSVNASGELVFGNGNWITRAEGVGRVSRRFETGRYHRASSSRRPMSARCVVCRDRGDGCARAVRGNRSGRSDEFACAIFPFGSWVSLTVKGQSFGQDQDDTPLIPYTTAREAFSRSSPSRRRRFRRAARRRHRCGGQIGEFFASATKSDRSSRTTSPSAT